MLDALSHLFLKLLHWCRQHIQLTTYEETEKPTKGRQCYEIPFERRPSNTYMEAMIFGAIEHNLPSDYVGFLVSFPTNKRFAAYSIRNELGYPYGSTLNDETELYNVLDPESEESTEQAENHDNNLEPNVHRGSTRGPNNI